MVPLGHHFLGTFFVHGAYSTSLIFFFSPFMSVRVLLVLMTTPCACLFQSGISATATTIVITSIPTNWQRGRSGRPGSIRLRIFVPLVLKQRAIQNLFYYLTTIRLYGLRKILEIRVFQAASPLLIDKMILYQIVS